MHNRSMTDTRPPLANAVIVVGGRYALQHRDDRPSIPWPGHWGLFGGSIEPGEAPDVAVAREIMEELGLAASFRLLFSTDVYQDWWGQRRELYVSRRTSRTRGRGTDSVRARGSACSTPPTCRRRSRPSRAT